MPFCMTLYAAEGPLSSHNAILYDKQDADDMIKCHLSRLMGERKVRVADVSLATGLHRNMLTLLYRETAQRVELDAIDKLCRYFGVPIGQLFEFIDTPQPVDR
jgi:putative transcriptional regulator